MAGHSLPVLVQVRGALVQRVVLHVDDRDRIASPVQHKKAPLVGTLQDVDGALAEGNGRVGCKGSKFDGGCQTGPISGGGWRDVASQSGRVGKVLADDVFALAG